MPPTVAVPQTAASVAPVAARAWRQPIGIGLAVDEAQRIDRLEARVALLERSLVHDRLEPLADAQPEVVAALAAHALGLLELLVVEHLAAGGALGPEVGRVGVPARPERQLDGHQASLPQRSSWRERRRARQHPGGQRDARRDGTADQHPAALRGGRVSPRRRRWHRGCRPRPRRRRRARASCPAAWETRPRPRPGPPARHPRRRHAGARRAPPRSGRTGGSGRARPAPRPRHEPAPRTPHRARARRAPLEASSSSR